MSILTKPPKGRYDDLEARFGEWEKFYNFHRPHGAHNGKTPYEALREKL
jgi:transposase InsO family protein